MKSMTIGSLVWLALFATVPQRALAWGAVGHRTVAAVAAQLLPAGKVQQMNVLLGQLEKDNNFIDAASYPDEYLRGVSKQWNDWHFADLPDDGGPFSCANDCLFDQLSDNLAVLRQGKHDKAEAVALAWVIHLVGDLHQPLHMTGNLRGGNGFTVTYRGQAGCPAPPHPKPFNLHASWDDCLVEELAMGRSAQQLGHDLLSDAGVTSYAGSPYIVAAHKGKWCPDLWCSWGDDSHDLANQVAFGTLKPNADLEDLYINGALPTVRDQLVKAGVRLAFLLDQNFK
jgi:hypothetical protein